MYLFYYKSFVIFTPIICISLIFGIIFMYIHTVHETKVQQIQQQIVLEQQGIDEAIHHQQKLFFLIQEAKQNTDAYLLDTHLQQANTMQYENWQQHSQFESQNLDGRWEESETDILAVLATFINSPFIFVRNIKIQQTGQELETSILLTRIR